MDNNYTFEQFKKDIQELINKYEHVNKLDINNIDIDIDHRYYDLKNTHKIKAEMS